MQYLNSAEHGAESSFSCLFFTPLGFGYKKIPANPIRPKNMTVLQKGERMVVCVKTKVVPNTETLSLAWHTVDEEPHSFSSSAQTRG
jgi:hypothetical protein